MQNRRLVLGKQIFGQIAEYLWKGQINHGNDQGANHVRVKQEFMGFIILNKFLENIHGCDRVPSQSFILL